MAVGIKMWRWCKFPVALPGCCVVVSGEGDAPREFTRVGAVPRGGGGDSLRLKIEWVHFWKYFWFHILSSSARL